MGVAGRMSNILQKKGLSSLRSQANPGDKFKADPDITASDATNAAKLAGEGFVAVPQTAWTTGQKITIGTFDFNWSGTAWAAGAHALLAFDPADYTIAEVQTYVTEHPDEAQAIRDLEAAGKARVTLLEWLDAFCAEYTAT